MEKNGLTKAIGKCNLEQYLDTANILLPKVWQLMAKLKYRQKKTHSDSIILYILQHDWLKLVPLLTMLKRLTHCTKLISYRTSNEYQLPRFARRNTSLHNIKSILHSH